MCIRDSLQVWEFGLSLALVPLLLIGLPMAARRTFLGRYHPAMRAIIATSALGVSSTALILALGSGIAMPLIALALGAAVVLALAAAGRRAVTALVFVTALATLGTSALHARQAIVLDRTFYGSYRVVEDSGQYRFVHGTTSHGSQFRDQARALAPTTYYVQDGPLGDVMRIASHLSLIHI